MGKEKSANVHITEAKNEVNRVIIKSKTDTTKRVKNNVKTFTAFESSFTKNVENKKKCRELPKFLERNINKNNLEPSSSVVSLQSQVSQESKSEKEQNQEIVWNDSEFFTV